jgi:tetratricopeptide (TPR) repeat protein
VIETDRGTFLLIDGQEGPPVACSPRQVDVQWSTYSDVIRESAGAFPFSHVRTSLAEAVAADQALFDVLGLLDTELEDDLRADLAADLETPIAKQARLERVLAILRSAPLPPSADLHGGIELATARGASRVVFMLVGLDADAPLIERAHSVWTEFAATFHTDSDAESARRWFARTGGFYELVESMRRNSGQPFATWMLTHARALPPAFGLEPLRALKQLPVIAGFSTGSRADAAHYVREEPDPEPRHAPREGRLERPRGREVLARVNAQIKEITRRLTAGDEETAAGFLDDLIEFQRAHGSTAEQRAKTLCNVAAQARAMNRLDFAERSLRQALTERPDDGWAHSQLSAVLRATGRLFEAHDAARLGNAYGSGPGALTHLAEALKAESRYSEALEKFDQAIDHFPDHVFARTGRAEVLRALGRYDEALISYADVIERFPDNIVAPAGRAEALKALGRYDEALKSYDDNVERFPDDVVSQIGGAEVLKALGRFDEALHRYEQIIERFPEDAVAQTGRAEVLQAFGRYQDALHSYGRVIELFPENVGARIGRAEVLKGLGRYDEALQSYDGIIALFPESVDARSGRAEVLKARSGRASVLLLSGRVDEALQALPSTKPGGTPALVALHIRGMISVRLDLLDEAQEIFQRGARDAGTTSRRNHFSTALAAVQLRRRQFLEVIRDLSPAAWRVPAEQRTTAAVLLAHASGAIAEVHSAEAWLDAAAATESPVVSELRAALAERYMLRVDGRIPPRTRPTAEIDRFIQEQEFRLLTVVSAA